MIRLDVTVPDITEVLAAGYTVIRVYTDSVVDGDFTTLDGTISLVADQSGYSYTDTDGTSSTFYKTAYYGAGPGEGSKSAAQQGDTTDADCTALDVRQELASGSGSIAVGQEHEDVLWNMCVEASRLIDDDKGVGIDPVQRSPDDEGVVEGEEEEVVVIFDPLLYYPPSRYGHCRDGGGDVVTELSQPAAQVRRDDRLTDRCAMDPEREGALLSRCPPDAAEPLTQGVSVGGVEEGEEQEGHETEDDNNGQQ